MRKCGWHWDARRPAQARESFTIEMAVKRLQDLYLLMMRTLYHEMRALP